MGREHDEGQSNSPAAQNATEGRHTQPAEQPRLVTPDGDQFAWPEATAPQEVSIFLRAAGEKNVLQYEKDLKAERNRKLSRESQRRLYKKRLQEDPEGFRAEQAAKQQRIREHQQQKAQEKRSSDTSGGNMS